MRPRALDLFCKAGGASVGLHRAGFDVLGSDIADQPRYPFAFTRRDVLSFETRELRQFDFIWASPPCQRHSRATRQTGNPEDHPNLIAPVRAMLKAAGVPYVIENVLNAPLIDPVMLCGAMFDLGVVRHRLFEFSWLVPQPAHPKHKGSLVTGEYVTVAGNGGVPAWTLRERERRGLPRHREGEYSLANWSRAMGIDWMDRAELVEAIPPAFAEWVGRQALDQIHSEGAHRMLAKAGC